MASDLASGPLNESIQLSAPVPTFDHYGMPSLSKERPFAHARKVPLRKAQLRTREVREPAAAEQSARTVQLESLRLAFAFQALVRLETHQYPVPQWLPIVRARKSRTFTMEFLVASSLYSTR